MRELEREEIFPSESESFSFQKPPRNVVKKKEKVFIERGERATGTKGGRERREEMERKEGKKNGEKRREERRERKEGKKDFYVSRNDRKSKETFLK